MTKEDKGRIQSWALDHNISLIGAQMDLLDTYLEELLRWNERTNLTGLKSGKRIINELLLDSLLPAPLLPDQGNLLDVGSGAGFPAVPLKIFKPGLFCTLFEAKGRKVSFLRHVIRLTKLEGIQVLRGRIEKESNGLLPDGYHIVTARALADFHTTIMWCAPYLYRGGILVGFLGSETGRILEANQEHLIQHRLAIHQCIPYILPGMSNMRHLLFLKKADR
jgi:16S rRNA (guanine527-N7)-methyltransferase